MQTPPVVADIIVVRSWVGLQATGATALILETQDSGIFALPLTAEAIEILRADLAKAETLLRRGTGLA